MYCAKCGSLNSDEAKFCKECGNEINNVKVPSQNSKEKKKNYYLDALKKYAVFTGRSTRKEYWMFFLYNFLIYVGLALIEVMFGGTSEIDDSLLVGIYQLAIYIPSLSIGVRRMHDVNKSGWFLLIPLYSLVLLTRDGTNGSNDYGSDPKIKD